MSGSELPAEVVERCIALVRAWANAARSVAEARQLGVEARAIVALLPKPVDPDLIEARELFIALEGGVDADRDVVIDIRQGKADCADEIRHLLNGIKRGRELQKAETSRG